MEFSAQKRERIFAFSFVTSNANNQQNWAKTTFKKQLQNKCSWCIISKQFDICNVANSQTIYADVAE